MDENLTNVNGSGKGTFLWGFLIGSAVGVLSGILLAPKSGKELRSDIRDKGNEAFEKSRQFYSDTREKTASLLQDIQNRAKELKQEIDRQLAEARAKAGELLRKGEKKSGEMAERYGEQAQE